MNSEHSIDVDAIVSIITGINKLLFANKQRLRDIKYSTTKHFIPGRGRMATVNENDFKYVMKIIDKISAIAKAEGR